jgi:3-methyladenine DNA glycosylase AlkD
MGREVREAFRAALEGAAAGATAESPEKAVKLLLPLLVPDPAAAPSKSGIRVSRDVLLEAAEVFHRALERSEVSRAVADALWATAQPEGQVVAARILTPHLVPDEQDEERTWEAVRSLASGALAPTIADALADSLARAMEIGAADSWSRAFLTWSSDPEARLRSLGPSAYAHLFGRGKSPEKLFDALQLARRLLGDPDATVRRSVVALLVAAGRRQAPAVERFLSGFEGDERSEVKKLIAEVGKRLRSRA